MARKTAKPTEKTAPAAKVYENPLLPHQRLREMHASLLAAQTLERNAARLLRAKGLAGFAGREAALLAVVPHLKEHDRVSAPANDIFLRLLRGANAKRLLTELRAKDPIAAADELLPTVKRTADRLTLAAGVALAAKAGKSDAIVVAYLDATDVTEKWTDVLAIAAKLELPVIFVCLDDAKMKKKARDRALKQLRAATRKGNFETVPVIPVDGHDVVAMYRAAQESIQRARIGVGPAVLWCERWSVEGKRRNAAREFEVYLAARGLKKH